MFRKTLVILLALSFLMAGGAWAADKAKVTRLPEGSNLTPRFITVGGEAATPIGTCVAIDYTCSITFFYPIPDGGGDIEEGMRFTNTNPNSEYLKAAQVLLYNGAGSSTDTVSDLVVDVYDNALGNIPGALRASVTVPNAVLISAGWPAGGIIAVTVNLAGSGLVYASGANYHITAQPAGAPGELNVLLDDGSCGSNRWVEEDGGGWHVVNIAFPGNDNNVHIYAVVCGYHDAPALTTYGLIVLALLLTGTAFWMVRKKRATVRV